jgi:hypothetical protein
VYQTRVVGFPGQHAVLKEFHASQAIARRRSGYGRSIVKRAMRKTCIKALMPPLKRRLGSGTPAANLLQA